MASSRSHFAPGSLLRITSPMYAPYADPSPFVLMEEGSFRYCSWRLPRISSTRLMESTHPDVPQRHSAIRLHVTQLHRRTQGRNQGYHVGKLQWFRNTSSEVRLAEPGGGTEASEKQGRHSGDSPTESLARPALGQMWQVAARGHLFE